MAVKLDVKSKAKSVVKHRIINVLDADRVMCAQNTLEHIQEDLKHTLSKYTQTDSEHIQCQIRLQKNTKGESCPLVISIVPLKRDIL